MTDEDLNVLDELAETSRATLAYYRELMREGRYTDARECLEMNAQLTHQIHNIEERNNRNEFNSLIRPSVSYSPADASF